MQCPYCAGSGDVSEPFVILFHAWDALYDVLQGIDVPPNVVRHIQRTQSMLITYARTLRLDLDTSIRVIRQDLDERKD